MNHGLHATVTPVLVLFEVAHETASGDSGEPCGHHPLEHLPQHQSGQAQAQAGAQQAHGTFDDAQLAQGLSKGQGQILGAITGHLDPIDLGHLQDHLGIHRCGAQQIHPWQRIGSDNPRSHPAVAVNAAFGFPRPLVVQQVTPAAVEGSALQKDVVGNQFLPLGVQHNGEALQQIADVRQRLQRATAGLRNRLRRGAAGHHISSVELSLATGAKHLQEPFLLVNSA